MVRYRKNMRKTSRKKRQSRRKAKRTCSRGIRTQVGGVRRTWRRRALLPLITALAAGATPHPPLLDGKHVFSEELSEKEGILSQATSGPPPWNRRPRFEGAQFTPNPGGYTCDDPGTPTPGCGSDRLRKIEEEENKLAEMHAEVYPDQLETSRAYRREMLAGRHAAVLYFMEQAGMTAQEARDEVASDLDSGTFMRRAMGGVLTTYIAANVARRAVEEERRRRRLAARARVVAATAQRQERTVHQDLPSEPWDDSFQDWVGDPGIWLPPAAEQLEMHGNIGRQYAGDGYFGGRLPGEQYDTHI
jgi:hypothetical protein